MSKQTVTIELDMPDGFRATGEYRIPKRGEWFASAFDGRPTLCNVDDFIEIRFILHKPPLVPGFLGCVEHNETGEVLFVTRAGELHLFYVSENGKASSGWAGNTTLYEHPDVPNTPELLQCFEGRN